MGMMRKMAKKKSIFGKRRSVFAGTRQKTKGGLAKGDLKKNKRGKIVSRAASDAAKKRKGYKKVLAWTSAVKAARRGLGLKGWVSVNGKTSNGRALYARAKSLYAK